MLHACQQIYLPLPKSLDKLHEALVGTRCVTKLGENFLLMNNQSEHYCPKSVFANFEEANSCSRL